MAISSNPLILLASASPRRSALLTQIGVPHAIHPVDIDETVQPGEAPSEYVYRLARTKAQTLWDRLSPADRKPVLGADTTVAIGANILGKPASAGELLQMLRRLSGRTHEVHTAVALCSDEGAQMRLSVSEVTFGALNDIEIIGYWESGEPADKAGGYAVQGRGAVFIERIHGSYSGVMGLPLFETAQLLQTIGWQPFPITGKPVQTSTHASNPTSGEAQ